MNWVQYGPNALLFQFANSIDEASLAMGCAIAADIERHPPDGLLEFVPAFTTILLIFDRHTRPQHIAPSLRDRFQRCTPRALPQGAPKEISVLYNGPDLDRVAELNGLTPKDVVDLHSSRIYRVYMLGFAPGFPYLGELDPKLHTPRLASPRPRVPTGSVAIGGEHTGIYSVESPGGWNLIGSTRAKLFAPDAADVADTFLLRPGERVRFVPVRSL